MLQFLVFVELKVARQFRSWQAMAHLRYGTVKDSDGRDSTMRPMRVYTCTWTQMPQFIQGSLIPSAFRSSIPRLTRWSRISTLKPVGVRDRSSLSKCPKSAWYDLCSLCSLHCFNINVQWCCYCGCSEWSCITFWSLNPVVDTRNKPLKMGQNIGLGLLSSSHVRCETKLHGQRHRLWMYLRIFWLCTCLGLNAISGAGSGHLFWRTTWFVLQKNLLFKFCTRRWIHSLTRIYWFSTQVRAHR